MSTPVLELADVQVLADGRPILDVPRLAIDARAVVALVGPNGAGKTTLLHVAALLRRPEQGVVTILGERATAKHAAKLRRQLSVVFQDPLLFDVRVLENAAAGARFQGRGRREAERRALEWLGRFGMAHLAQRRARSLSGGEAARVALARAFVTDPALLLLDEPFSALDAPTRAALLPELRTLLRENGKAAVLVTHDLNEAFAFADRVVLMDGGRIVASGDAGTLLARPPTRRAAELLGIDNILAARIERTDGAIAMLSVLPEGPLVRACLASGASGRLGQEVVITLPAGAAMLQAGAQQAPPGWNHLPGHISELTPLRTGMQVTIETPAPFVIATPWATGERPWSIGDTATVVFPPTAANVVLDLE